MGSYLKNLKLLFVIIVGLVLLTSCGSDENTTDVPSQNEGSSSSSSSADESNQNNDNPNTSSDIYADRTENLKTYAERKLIFPITVPFEIHHTKLIKDFSHRHSLKYPYQDKTMSYYPKAGFIGSDTMTMKVFNNSSETKSIEITYNIEVKEQPLDGFRDFLINFHCEQSSRQFGGYQNIDLDIMDNNLERIIKIYDDLQDGWYTLPSPRVSKIQLEYFNATTNETVVKHHTLLKNNLENNILLTCNYQSGYSSILFPLSSVDWKATSKINNGYEGVNYNFIRNDLYFYVSLLSSLHSKIYKKEYQQSNDSNLAFNNANTFMNNVFPESHYTAELARNYNTHPDNFNNPMPDIFDKDNKHYYTMLEYLADEVTNGSVTILLEKIAENYESYYLSANKKCLNKTICGALFPEYTTSLTNDPSFKEGLTQWTENKQIDTISSNGKVEYLPTKEQVSIEFNANIPASSSIPIATIDLFQTQAINGNNLDDYFLNFDLANTYGGSNGFAGYAGFHSSGLSGTYACYKDINEETLGCLAWTDYTNKSKFGWALTNEGLSFDFYRLHSNDTFYNTELKETFRRIAPPKERMLYITNLGEFTEKHLPKVYEIRNQIHSIEYGIFVSEFRSNSDNSCYYCEGKVTAYKIELLKVKE